MNPEQPLTPDTSPVAEPTTLEKPMPEQRAGTPVLPDNPKFSAVGMRMVPSRFSETAKRADYLDAAGMEDLANTYDLLAEWLKLPMYRDTFTDHTERRQWYETLDEQELATVERNKLRTNMIHPVLLRLEMLPGLLANAKLENQKSSMAEINKKEPSLPDIREVIRKGPTIPFEKRLEAIHALEEKVSDVLQLLSKP